MAAPYDLMFADNRDKKFPHCALDEERVGGFVIGSTFNKWNAG